MTETLPVRVTIWNENHHETTEDAIAAIYPSGIHGAIKEGIAPWLPADSLIRTATLTDPEHGLTEDVLAATDVLVWWGHARHDDVADDVVQRVCEHVLGGMGLVVLHSGHYSKVFRGLMGTGCSLNWRDDGDRELVWSVAPGHPITAGVEFPIVLDEQETYAEFFDVPAPKELITISSFAGGEVFRSGMTYTRGRGRIFYFSPGDQVYPIYFDQKIRRIIANAVVWARPVGSSHDRPMGHPITNENYFGYEPALEEGQRR